MELAAVLFWLVGSVVNGFIAAERGKSAVAATLFSLIGSPLLVWGYLVATPVGK